MKLFKSSFISAAMLLLAFALGSCAKEEMPDNRDKDFGYVQFKLYKAPQTKSAPLDLLGDARKVRVSLSFGDQTIYQTLTLDASSDAAAEFGLRSQKLQLVPGNYTILSFKLYDKMDNEIYVASAAGDFDVVSGGLCVHDLFAETKPRGSVKFTLGKSGLQTKAPSRQYTFDEIKSVDIVVKNAETQLTTTFKGLKTKFSVHFEDEGDNTNDRQTSSLACDSLLFLNGGHYTLDSYSIYDESQKLLEINTRPEECQFDIYDNATTEAELKVNLRESDDYIKDYKALKDIWEALGGPEWYYRGENYPMGANWNFNKDIDLWGDQPGVSLHGNGRVAVINLSDFGFKGAMPAAIGQFSEMIELYLGSHNDTNTTNPEFVGPDSKETDRMVAYKKYFAQLHPATPFSEPIALALMEHGYDIPEIALYKTLPEDQIINKTTGEPMIKPMDTKPGKICNGLTSIDPAIGSLVKLEKLFIANGKLTTLPDEMKNMEGLTDIEVYNCPEMKEFPMVLAELPALVSLNLSNNPQWSSEEADKGFAAICTGASKETIQIWYMGGNNLTKFPAVIKNLKKIGLMDLSFNKISKIEAMLGPSIKFVNLALSNNLITDESWPEQDPENHAGTLFFGYDDLEGFTMAHNQMKTFPNIFDAELEFKPKSIDFSFNDIRKFPSNFKGINVETLILANNPNMQKFPDSFGKSNSSVSMYNLRGCGLESLAEGAFESEKDYAAANLVSLDLSYNHLTDLPYKAFHSGNIPYMFGIDLSYNRFDHFPREVFDFRGLTVMAIRGQRDADGNRCLREWPDGYAEANWRGFYIGSNDLRKIEDHISPLCYNLDISDNPKIVFDASDICYAVKAGVFNFIYDKTQDIRNCPELFN